jgi:hypothetical protein
MLSYLSSEFLMHAGHDSDIVIIEQVDLLYVQLLRQLPRFISKEKLSNVVGPELPLARPRVVAAAVGDLGHKHVLVVFSAGF